jgi:hypothetical protein
VVFVNGEISWGAPLRVMPTVMYDLSIVITRLYREWQHTTIVIGTVKQVKPTVPATGEVKVLVSRASLVS